MSFLTTSRLRVAAKNGDPLAISDALNKGGDPLAFVTHGVSALTQAMEGGHDECVALLLSRADKEQLKSTHAFAWFLAAAGGHLTPLKLLARHFNPRLRTGSGATALSVAAANGQTHCLPYLAEVADPAHCGPHGTALHAAARHGQAECIPFLLTVCDLKARDDYNLTALHVAIDRADPETARALLANAQPARDLMAAMEHEEAFSHAFRQLLATRAQRLNEPVSQDSADELSEDEIGTIECLSILAPFVKRETLADAVERLNAELYPTAATAPLRAVFVGEQPIAPLSADLARRRLALKAQREEERTKSAPKQPSSRF